MNDSASVTDENPILPLKAIFSDFLNRYQSEYQKGNTLKKNPYMRDLKERTSKVFEAIPKSYNVKVRPMAGNGNLNKKLPYISFLSPGHKVSQGFYPIFDIVFATQQVKLYLGCSDKNAMTDSLIERLKSTARKELSDFRDQSPHGFPLYAFKPEEVSDELLSTNFFRVLNVYRQCLEECKEDFQAFFERSNEDDSEEDEREDYSDPPSFWVIAGGKGGEKVDAFVLEGKIGIGFDVLEDLTPFDTIEKVEKLLKKQPSYEGDHPNKARACFEFAQHMIPGDVVFLRSGIRSVRAVGVVTSDYQFNEGEEEAYRHTCRVSWVAKGEWTILPDEQQLAQHTLTDITEKTDRIEQIKILTGWDAYAAEIVRIQTDFRFASPFRHIFSSKEEANEAFELFALAFNHLKITSSSDERISFTVPSGDPGVHLNLGIRRILGFDSQVPTNIRFTLHSSVKLKDAEEFFEFKENKKTIGIGLRSMEFDEFLLQKEVILPMFIKALEVHGNSHKRPSPHKQAHVPLIAEAVLDKNIRKRVLAFGLGEKAKNKSLKIEVERESMTSENKKKTSSMNRIYFGPPGTGKTWAIQNQEIPNFISAEKSLSSEERLMELVKNEPWWTVIAAALLDLGTTKVSTVAEHELVRARHAISGSKHVKNQIWTALQSHTFQNCPNVSYTSRQEPFLFIKNEDSSWEIRADAIDNNAPEVRELLLKSKVPASDGQRVERFEVITFHQAFSYEDFIEGIKPVSDGDTEGQLRYEIQAGVFKRLCERARADLNNEYAIFIDEINRGNVANIFGELISLIEEDKREGSPGELKIKLPYSKENFCVPPNVSIIGTMNTADRSVEALDTALRRRFTFIEIRPDSEVLKANRIAVPGIDIVKLFETINARIEKLLDRDHMLGHAYFLELTGSRGTLENLQSLFANKILPLMQEYFFGDLGRIGLVLGKRFVGQVGGQVSFADFDHGDREAVEERAVYKLNDPSTISAEDFASIYAEAN